MSEIITSAPHTAGGEQPQQGFIRRHAKGLTAGVAVVALGAGSLAFVETSGNSEAETRRQAPVSAEAAKANCQDFVSSNAADNANLYRADAFLPKGKIATGLQAESYTTSLFGKNGPLAGNGDLGSLAALRAVLTVPAEKGDVNVSYSPQEQFATEISNYSAEQGGNQAIIDACESTFTVMNATGNYTSSFATAGQKVTRFAPTRGSDFKIETGSAEDLKVQHIVLNHTLSGVEFLDGPTVKQVQGHEVMGFTPVLATPDGEVYEAGFAPAEAGTTESNQGLSGNTQNTLAQAGILPNLSQAPAGSTEKVTKNANGTIKSITITAPNGATTTITPNGPNNGPTITQTGGGAVPIEGAPAPTGTGTGTTGPGSTGTGPGNTTPGTSPNHGPGTTTGTTPNTAPSTTRATTPPTSPPTVPPTTPPTSPPTTQPAVTTTTGTKGAAPTTTICVGTQFNPC